jgi:hypothetical protein
VLSALITNVAGTAYVAYGAVQVAESTGSTGSVGDFVQYGVLGLVVIGFLTGWIVPGPTAKQLLSENQRLSALVEKVIPVAVTYAATMEKSNAALEKAAEAIERIDRRHTEVEKRLAAQDRLTGGQG